MYTPTGATKPETPCSSAVFTEGASVTVNQEKDHEYWRTTELTRQKDRILFELDESTCEQQILRAKHAKLTKHLARINKELSTLTMKGFEENAGLQQN
jgi:hypothetical protein